MNVHRSTSRYGGTPSSRHRGCLHVPTKKWPRVLQTTFYTNVSFEFQFSMTQVFKGQMSIVKTIVNLTFRAFSHCHSLWRVLPVEIWPLLGEQWLRSGERIRLPSMWPGFDFQTRRHMWVEFIGSLLCSSILLLVLKRRCGLSLLVLFSALRGFLPGTPVFPSPQKPAFD